MNRCHYRQQRLGLIFGMLVFFAVGAGSQNKQPDLVIEATTFDFGTVPTGSLISHDFMIQNAGNEVLDIQNVSPT
jgi:hypothetical protein